jgi:DNA-binding NtrC family response regulator
MTAVSVKSWTLALVDDDKNTLESIRICLQNDLDAEIDIVTFSSGKSFLDAVRERRFDVLVVDLQMPEMSGMDIIREVKSFQRAISVVVLTGNPQILRRHLDLHPHIFEVLVKPVEYQQLLRTVKDGLACSRIGDPSSRDDRLSNSKPDHGSVTRELIRLNREIRKLLHSSDPARSELMRLVDSQEKLMSRLENSDLPASPREKPPRRNRA